MCEPTSNAGDFAAFDADMTVYVAAGLKVDAGAWLVRLAPKLSSH